VTDPACQSNGQPYSTLTSQGQCTVLPTKATSMASSNSSAPTVQHVPQYRSSCGRPVGKQNSIIYSHPSLMPGPERPRRSLNRAPRWLLCLWRVSWTMSRQSLLHKVEGSQPCRLVLELTMPCGSPLLPFLFLSISPLCSCCLPPCLVMHAPLCSQCRFPLPCNHHHSSTC
jgi:hypothetical protein